ncbi:hypothetical protein BGZ54_009038, partial [Gamsiella multidivaricata]
MPHHAHGSPSPYGPGSQQYFSHDHRNRQSSSVGSLPDLYMGSSSAPSTTTTSSLSRADSLSTMEYLQGSHPHTNIYGLSRHHPGIADNVSTTIGSTTGSSYGYSAAGSTGSREHSLSHHHHHHHHQHSAGHGRADLDAAVHQHQLHQQRLQEPVDYSTAGSLSAAVKLRVRGGVEIPSIAGGRVRLTGSSAGSEQQGRNSTKRAAQNRAAQRAFRQRKDQYVRELERKAELLLQAEGRIMELTKRNRELEAALEDSRRSTSSNSPRQPRKSSPISAADEPSEATEMKESTAVNELPTSMDSEQEKGVEDPERSPQEGHKSQEPSTRPPLSRYASMQQLQQQATPHQRSDSNYEIEDNNSNPRYYLRHHRSESCLSQGRRGTKYADTGDDCSAAQERHDVRGGSTESRFESPLSTHGAQRSNSPHFDCSEPSSPSSKHQYSGTQGSLFLQKQALLHSIPTIQGDRSGSAGATACPDLSSARSWYRQTEDSAKPYYPLETATFSDPTAHGGMVAAASSPSKEYSDHPGARVAEIEYMSDDRSEYGSEYDTIEKRPSDGSIGWPSANSI